MIDYLYHKIFLFRTLFFFILFFPIILITGSLAINLTLTIITIIYFIYFFKINIYKDFNNNLINFFFIFFFYIFINSLINFKNIEIIFKSLAQFRYLFFSLIIFLSLLNLSEKKFYFFLLFNFVFIVIFGIDILIQFSFGKDLFGFLPGMNGTRFSGFFNNYLVGGAYLSQIGSLILILLFNNFKKYKYVTACIFFVFLLSIILLTGERTATLIFLGSFLLIGILFREFSKTIILILLSISIFFIFFYFNSITKNRYFDQPHDIIQNNISSKNYISKIKASPWGLHWQAATELFLDKPIFGNGLKSFRLECSKTNIYKEHQLKKSDYPVCTTHPHNYAFEFLSEYGIVGFLFYFYLIINILVTIYKTSLINHKNIYQNSLLSIGSLLLVILIPVKPSGSFFSTFNASIFFFILGFYFYYYKKTLSK